MVVFCSGRHHGMSPCTMCVCVVCVWGGGGGAYNVCVHTYVLCVSVYVLCECVRVCVYACTHRHLMLL